MKISRLILESYALFVCFLIEKPIANVYNQLIGHVIVVVRREVIFSFENVIIHLDFLLFNVVDKSAYEAFVWLNTEWPIQEFSFLLFTK